MKTMTNPIYDLHYSSMDDDETGKGWYFSVYPSFDVSQSFETETEARLSYKNNELVFSGLKMEESNK